ncbi:MAG: hypothetical protein AABY44_04845 [Nitrospirota bacterium]
MKKFHFILFLYTLLILGSCAQLRPAKVEQPLFVIETAVNVSPVTKENEQSLRSLRHIAVAPFVEKKSASREWAEEAVKLLGRKRVSIEGPDTVMLFLARTNRSADDLTNDERLKLAQRIGKALKTDSIIIGTISPLNMEDNRRVTTELIQTSTGKILWWQAIDIAVKKGIWEPSREEIIRRVVPELLGRLPELIGTSEKIEKPEKIERPEPKKPAIEISPM